MKYKLICTDMDGTLFNSNKEISERTKEAIKKAHQLGVKIVLATGRIYNFAALYADTLGIEAPVISANGAFVRSKNHKDVIYKKVIGLENNMKILAIFNKYGIVPHYYTPDSAFSGELVQAAKVYMERNKLVPEELRVNVNIIKGQDSWEKVFKEHDEEILKCIGMDDDLEKVLKAKEELKKIDGIEVSSSFINNIEINGREVTKGRAVEITAALYDIDREEIICIGDNENDLSMIEYAGLGVAMGNAEEHVKQKADYVTDTNDEDGVAKVIEKFVINEHINGNNR
ncbi:Cof-type HAD-IIB family hydrolase [Clostridium polynesiense]|uniref:Cof-type HAD-IIB family hydrolase n=1 Tax=Clostridium polynesiense TaxID=1325933 RepID=UPI00058BCF7E|nr:Cof-type HAD-IIB family hydrolase [Clostridium polynesiense]